MAAKREKEMVGTVFISTHAKGSKSEHEACYLRLDDGSEVRVRVKGENAFEQPTLKKLVGRRVRLADCILHNSIWIAASAAPISS